MADLIDSTRAKQAIGTQSSFTSDETTLIGVLITAASKAIKRYCRREFDSQTFHELYDGHGHARLQLRQFPIISVSRVATTPTKVLEITNTSSTVQRATVALTSTTLSLVRVASGSSTTSTLTLADADKDTIGELATAVTAVGSGWAGSVPDTTYSNWASADLLSVQGALNAKDPAVAGLYLHVEELSAYEVDAERGWLIYGQANTAPAHPHEGTNGWPIGMRNIRVSYVAGYSTVPEDIQEACAQWVANLYHQARRDPGLSQDQVPGAYSRTSYLSLHGVPKIIQALLAPHVNLTA